LLCSTSYISLLIPPKRFLHLSLTDSSINSYILLTLPTYVNSYSLY